MHSRGNWHPAMRGSGRANYDPAHGNLSAAQLENGGSEPDDRQFLVGLRFEAPKACSCWSDGSGCSVECSSEAVMTPITPQLFEAYLKCPSKSAEPDNVVILGERTQLGEADVLEETRRSLAAAMSSLTCRAT
jgi:hypothetical protein